VRRPARRRLDSPARHHHRQRVLHRELCCCFLLLWCAPAPHRAHLTTDVAKLACRSPARRPPSMRQQSYSPPLFSFRPCTVKFASYVPGHSLQSPRRQRHPRPSLGLSSVQKSRRISSTKTARVLRSSPSPASSVFFVPVSVRVPPRPRRPRRHHERAPPECQSRTSLCQALPEKPVVVVLFNQAQRCLLAVWFSYVHVIIKIRLLDWLPSGQNRAGELPAGMHLSFIVFAQQHDRLTTSASSFFCSLSACLHPRWPLRTRPIYYKKTRIPCFIRYDR
jgi:hypothetical protein